MTEVFFMIQTIELFPGITLRCCRDDRFKQSVLSLQFLRPMCREEAALNALLPAVLLRGCKSAPDMRAITLKLDDLYGAAVGALVRRIGDIHCTGLSCGFIDDRFALEGDRIFAPMMAFLEEILLDPVLEAGVFREDFVASEKQNLIWAIEAQRNDKRSYATNQMLRIMCKDDSYGIPRLGEISDVEAITPESLYAHYQKILTTSPIHVFYVGSAPAEVVAQTLAPMLRRLAKKTISLPAQTGFTPVDFSEHEEVLDVAQGKLCMGFATPINLRHPQYPAILACNAILGAGMTSKLFMQVREKMSLCYDIGSGFHGSKGILTVASGIEFEKKEVVQAQVNYQLQQICDGNISEGELTAAKEALLSNLRSTHDSPGAIESYYAAAAISGIGMTPDEFMEKVHSVTVKDVSAAAKTLSLQTVYFLRGEA
jgi:predicted Zn-dependent peptidase